MINGHFYFIKNTYFDKFKDRYLMTNKIDTGRPCFFAFSLPESPIKWLVPISSRISKYKKIYNKKRSKIRNYSGLAFSFVNEKECAFLFQNMCPVTEKYIETEYIKDNKPVELSKKETERMIKIARNNLNLYKRGIKIMFPDILKIERELLAEE